MIIIYVLYLSLWWKDEAQQYFNKIIKNSELSILYLAFIISLKRNSKENISLGVSNFMDPD